MEEEFREADVLWPDRHGQADGDGDGRRGQRQWPCREQQPHAGGEAARRRAGSPSAPVGIPGVVARSWVRGGGGDDDGAAPFVPPCREQQPHAGGEAARRRAGSPSAPVGIPGVVARSWVRGGGGDDDGAAPFVPPHEVAARRRCAEAEAEARAAASVCVGHGRTLKGRDLRCVRTAVLRMTGFLEN